MIRHGARENESFAQRLRSARTRSRTTDGQRWTQKSLATAVGVERNTVSRWENGGMLPKDPVVLARLARILGVDTEWLISGDSHPLAPVANDGERVREGRPGRTLADPSRSQTGPSCEAARRELRQSAVARRLQRTADRRSGRAAHVAGREPCIVDGAA